MVSEFITACLEESTLLDEEGQFPYLFNSVRANGLPKNLYPNPVVLG